jgi:23S rRNA (uracil1939-C5)-methyltransferase
MTHCAHYGICGGCAVDDRFVIDKFALLENTLARAGFLDAPVARLVDVPLSTRRRVDLAATRKGTEISLGLHKARGADVVDMRECVLLLPAILPLLPPLRELLRSLQAFRRAGSVVINYADNGPDILFRLDAEFTLPDRSRLIAFAKAHNAPRISIAVGNEEPEPVIILANPVVNFSGVAVEPPPGGFLQASREGEAAIISAVLAGLPKLGTKSHVVELFAGSGTLSFALVQHARVEAYEGDEAAATSAERAIRAHNLAGRMTMARRDLHRRPLQAAEMAKAAAVVLDPPFAGAAAQMRFIAASNVPRVIYVSCNPEALAHDISHLRRAGYSLLSATPIDQFPFSQNLESVVVLAKLK